LGQIRRLVDDRIVYFRCRKDCSRSIDWGNIGKGGGGDAAPSHQLAFLKSGNSPEAGIGEGLTALALKQATRLKAVRYEIGLMTIGTKVGW
jgi:hypothetical protein